MNQVATTTAGINSDSFEAYLASRHEPAWLVEKRREAWRTFNELDLPARNEEEWMRTDIRLFRLEKFGLPGELSAGATAPAALLAHGVTLAGQMTTLNSRHLSGHLDPKWAARGVVFGSLDTLVNEHSDLIRRNLYRAVNPSIDKFAALHGACWSGGSFLYVPRGVVVD